MKIDEKALDAAMEADIRRMYGTDKPSPNTIRQFKEDNRDEYVCTITAYLKAVEETDAG